MRRGETGETAQRDRREGAAERSLEERHQGPPDGARRGRGDERSGRGGSVTNKNKISNIFGLWDRFELPARQSFIVVLV